MGFVPKDWRDFPDLTTALNAAALEDLESRIVAYTDSTYDRTLEQGGLVAPMSLAYPWATTVTLIANNAYGLRFVPSRDMTISKIGFAVTTAAGSNDSCDVALYDSALSRLVSAGATAGKLNATGKKTVAVTPTVVTAGAVYYAAFSVGAIGSTAAVLYGISFNNSLGSALFGTAAPNVDVLFNSSAHPLPTPFSGANSTTTIVLTVEE